MAFTIPDHLYRVALNSERHFIYISAKNRNELIDYLANEISQKGDVFSVKEVGSDGALTTVTVLTDPRYQALINNSQAEEPHKQPLSNIIEEAESKARNQEKQSHADQIAPEH